MKLSLYLEVLELQWLDVHLPSMVETLVREEIQRIERQADQNR